MVHVQRCGGRSRAPRVEQSPAHRLLETGDARLQLVGALPLGAGAGEDVVLGAQGGEVGGRLRVVRDGGRRHDERVGAPALGPLEQAAAAPGRERRPGAELGECGTVARHHRSELLAAEGRLVLVERTEAAIARPQHAAGVPSDVAALRQGEPAERADRGVAVTAVGRRLGEPRVGEGGRADRAHVPRQPCPQQQRLRELWHRRLTHAVDQPLGTAQERSGGLSLLGPRGDREEVGLQAGCLTRLRAHERRALVGRRGGTGPVPRGQRRLRHRHQQVGPLAGQEWARGQGLLGDGAGVVREAACQEGGGLVEDQVHAGDAQRVVLRCCVGVRLERLRQVAAEVGHPARVVACGRDLHGVARTGRQLPEQRERVGGGVERAELGVGEPLEIERPRFPHLVPGAREEPACLAQVGGALLEAGQQVARHHRPAHQHPTEWHALEGGRSAIEVTEPFARPTGEGERHPHRCHHVRPPLGVVAPAREPQRGPQLGQRPVGMSEVAQHDADHLVPDRRDVGVGGGHELGLGRRARRCGVDEQGAQHLVRLGPVHGAILADRAGTLGRFHSARLSAALASCP